MLFPSWNHTKRTKIILTPFFHTQKNYFKTSFFQSKKHTNSYNKNHAKAVEVVQKLQRGGKENILSGEILVAADLWKNQQKIYLQKVRSLFEEQNLSTPSPTPKKNEDRKCLRGSGEEDLLGDLYQKHTGNKAVQILMWSSHIWGKQCLCDKG